MGGAASTTGWDDGPPTVTGAQIGDSGTGLHLVGGILGALFQRERTGRGQRVEVAMVDSVLNLCRVKMRDQQRIMKGPLPEYPNEEFGDAVPRAGNASGGGQPGSALRCAPGGPNDYVYVIIQPPCWAPLMKIVGRPELIEDPHYATPEARLSHIPECFSIIEKWTMTKSKFEVMDTLNPFDIPCGPILSMKDLYEDRELYERGMLVELDHPARGRYVQVGMPIKLSDSPAEVTRSPLLGEHTDEVLGWLGYADSDIKKLRDGGAV
jgi:formyl-CoA transferase